MIKEREKVGSLLYCYYNLITAQVPVYRKFRKLFGPVKQFLVQLYLNSREVYMPETSCMKRTSVNIKNMWIKQLCDLKVWDFAMAFRVRNLFGTFEKRAPDFYRNWSRQWAELMCRLFCYICVLPRIKFLSFLVQNWVSLHVWYFSSLILKYLLIWQVLYNWFYVGKSFSHSFYYWSQYPFIDGHFRPTFGDHLVWYNNILDFW